VHFVGTTTAVSRVFHSIMIFSPFLGNKVRQEKIQKIEEEYKKGGRHKKDKERKGKFFKDPSDNNYM
jgi:hypothetical protein